MDERMTLEQVRDWLLARTRDGQLQRSVFTSDYQLRQMADAIDAHLARPAQAVDVDSLAQEIRRVDGNHSLGAGALAEALMPLITRAIGNAQAEGWRLIETAPKDGARVLLSSAHGVWMAEYRPVYQSGYRPDDPWCSTMLNHDHLPEAGRYAKPTHWMPLPTPPTKDTPNAHE